MAETDQKRIIFLLVAAVTLMQALLYVGSISIDDAFITFRYAENLSRHGELAYNLAGDSAFATTAPGYAVLLATLHRVGADIPLAASLLGALSIGAAAIALSDLLSRLPRPTSLLSALLLASTPLLWLVLGLEGIPALALALAGLALARRGQDDWAALALALATLLRFDAAAAAAIWGLWTLARRGRGALPVMVHYLAAVLLPYGALMALLGVPLPSTLGSKQAQQTLGISGFFADTSWLDGIRLLARGYAGHSWVYGLWAALALAGLGVIVWAFIRSTRDESEQGERSVPSPYTPLVVITLWAIAHAALYIALDVTPYVWYYLPLAVPLAGLAALAVGALGQGISGGPRGRWLAAGLGALLSILLLAAPMASHLAMWQRLQASADLAEPGLESKVLPEAKDEPYRAAGEWLDQNAPDRATVGVTEVGIMGYYSRRPMLDFLGLLDGDTSAALARGDLAWALYHHQPDFLVLSDVNPIYGFDVYLDRWFQGAYTPVHKVPASGFWGGALTIYQRQTPLPQHGAVSELPASAERTSVRFGEFFELAGLTEPAPAVTPGDSAGVTFYWRVLQSPPKDYTLFVHLIDEDGRIISARDARPLLGSRGTSQWQPGELLADFHPLGLPPLPLTPRTLRYEIGFYDETGARLPAFDAAGTELPGAQALVGELELLPPMEPVVMKGLATAGADEVILVARQLTLDSGQVAPGQSARLQLTVEACTCPLNVTVELWDSASQQVSWSQTIVLEQPGALDFNPQLPEGAGPGWQEARLRATTESQSLFWMDAANHPIQDSVTLTSIQIVP